MSQVVGTKLMYARDAFRNQIKHEPTIGSRRLHNRKNWSMVMWDAKVWKQEEPLIERPGKGGIASTLPCHHCTNAVASLLVSFSESLYHQIRNMVALSDTLCVPEPSLLIRFCFQLHCMSVSVLKHVAAMLPVYLSKCASMLYHLALHVNVLRFPCLRLISQLA